MTKLLRRPLNEIIGTDVSPMLFEKIIVGEYFLNIIFHFFGGISSYFMERSCSSTYNLILVTCSNDEFAFI